MENITKETDNTDRNLMDDLWSICHEQKAQITSLTSQRDTAVNLLGEYFDTMRCSPGDWEGWEARAKELLANKK